MRKFPKKLKQKGDIFISKLKKERGMKKERKGQYKKTAIWFKTPFSLFIFYPISLFQKLKKKTVFFSKTLKKGDFEKKTFLVKKGGEIFYIRGGGARENLFKKGENNPKKGEKYFKLGGGDQKTPQKPQKRKTRRGPKRGAPPPGSKKESGAVCLGEKAGNKGDIKHNHELNGLGV